MLRSILSLPKPSVQYPCDKTFSHHGLLEYAKDRLIFRVCTIAVALPREECRVVLFDGVLHWQAVPTILLLSKKCSQLARDWPYRSGDTSFADPETHEQGWRTEWMTVLLDRRRWLRPRSD